MKSIKEESISIQKCTNWAAHPYGIMLLGLGQRCCLSHVRLGGSGGDLGTGGRRSPGRCTAERRLSTRLSSGLCSSAGLEAAVTARAAALRDPRV